MEITCERENCLFPRDWDCKRIYFTEAFGRVSKFSSEITDFAHGYGQPEKLLYYVI